MCVGEVGLFAVFGGAGGGGGIVEEEVEFDSQDEDECEELFMGIWTPQGAAKRREGKAFARRRE